MPHALIEMSDAIRLHVEERGAGVPILFLHEFAGNWSSWLPQMQAFASSYRCIAFSARGYPPSDVPRADHAYSQEIACRDALAIMDALGVDKAHIVGHSMGAYTALHVALRHPERCLSITAAGCGWGSNPADRAVSLQLCAEIATLFRTEPMEKAADSYAHFPMRLRFKEKDPSGFAEFISTLAGNSAEGSALTMLNVQATRPTLWDMEDQLRTLRVPLLVILGDEDLPCLEGSLFLKRTVPGSGLHILPWSGHTIPSEEPKAFNAALRSFMAATESGTPFEISGS